MLKITTLAAVLSIAAISGAMAQDFAEAGSKLRPGEEAVVPFLIPHGPEVPVSLTVTAIEKGAIADLGNFELPPELSDAQPYYVRFTYTNLGDEDLANYQVSGFVGFDAAGNEIMPSMTMGGNEPFTQCQNPAPASLAKGESSEGCVLLLVGGNTELVSAGYRGNYRYEEGKNTEADFPIYYDPVLWAAAADAEPSAKGKVIAPIN